MNQKFLHFSLKQLKFILIQQAQQFKHMHCKFINYILHSNNNHLNIIYSPIILLPQQSLSPRIINRMSKQFRLLLQCKYRFSLELTLILLRRDNEFRFSRPAIHFFHWLNLFFHQCENSWNNFLFPQWQWNLRKNSFLGWNLT